ncbi:flagellar motor protein MotA [Acinetobacter sp. ANC 4558]|uniref:MotA/TolQ/ExbB proton channel family protein n=1 Tax=Acinetobacter sp. ANC 4558 TaxID=1977876 RepID=UPI000A32D47A|nr:MotA/TolQ/ExbB proton channel family protein [Acinetobacter sp. ANC 4558]OTG86167.1 flagellar motor protein MotA [Acinetobacter sp. ANC 4558]
MADLTNLIHDMTVWLLIGLSILTWLVIVVKVFQTYKAYRQNIKFIGEFWTSKNLQDAVLKANTSEGSAARVAQTGFDTLIHADDQTHQDLQQTWSRQDLLERHLRKQILSERRNLDKGTAVLASIGNNAPFIGLFGTVFGIIHALKAIAITGNASMDTVAGPIGEALIATGLGIAVAVPAVLAYNYFVRKVKTIGAQLDDFGTDLVSLNQKNGFRVPSVATTGTKNVKNIHAEKVLT